MQGKRKEFSQELYDANDLSARLRVIDFFSPMMARLGFDIDNSEDQYAPDIEIRGNDGAIVAHIEVEVKHAWDYGVFPFDTIQLPERRKKSADIGCRFAMLNRHHTRMAYILPHVLLQSPLVEVANKYVKSGEMFYQVPTSEAIFYQLRAE
jgi:hypothetical protein